MVVVPLSATGNTPETSPAAACTGGPDWIRIAAAGTLAAGGVLLMANKRRAGLVVAVAGASPAVIDQKDIVSAW